MKRLFKLSVPFFAFAGILGVFYLKSFQPKRTGTIQTSQISSKVTVHFDKWAIPHIEADSEADGFFALGYIHAGDRFFQMDVLRSLAKGELSSLFGEKFIKIDKFFRALDIRHIATKTVARLDRNHPATTALTKYVAGINAFLEKGKKPIEYHILGISPKPFTAADTIAISGYMSFNFAQSFKIDPLLHYVEEKLGHEHYRDFVLNLAPQSKQQAINVRSSLEKTHKELLQKTSSTIEEIGTNFPLFTGSNAWIVSGKLTKSGYPILANDPHIQYSSPSVWYEAHMKTPSSEIYGHHMAGIPIPPIGHTLDKAWGITMFQNDDIFFYKEKINPANPNEVMHEGAWVPLTIREEKIYVKGQKEPVVFVIKHSPHGPIMNDVVEEFNKVKEPVAMWWAFANPQNDMLTAFYDLAREKDFKKIPNHLSKIHAPGLNIMYADKAKNIAWWGVARIPDFAESINTQNFLDGTKPEHQITKFIPFAKNPHLINPKDNFIVSANHDPKLTLQNSRRIPGYYSNGQRYYRIRELIQARKDKWDSEAMKAVHMDDQDKIHEKIVPILVKTLGSYSHSKQSEEALQHLVNWKGSHQLKDIGPTIYYMFISHMVHSIFEKKLPEELFRHLMGSHHLYSVIESLVQKPNSVWWQVSSEQQNQEQIMQQAWKRTLSTLEKNLSHNPSEWHWSKVHLLEQEHPIGKKKPFNLIFNVGPTPVTGGYETIDKESFHLSTELPFKVKSGPSTRRIIDLADTRSSLGINPKGQAGYFFDDHYADQLELFAKGEYREQLMDMEKVKQQTHQTLTFIRE